MSTQASAILTNTATRVAAVTAQTAIGGRKTFRHQTMVYDAEDLLDLKDPTRAFSVVFESADEGVPLLSQTNNTGPQVATYELAIAYKQAKSGTALMKAIGEDRDDVTHELQRVDGDRYDETNTKLWRRRVTGSTVEYDEGSGGVALLRMTVACDYLPS